MFPGKLSAVTGATVRLIRMGAASTLVAGGLMFVGTAPAFAAVYPCQAAGDNGWFYDYQSQYVETSPNKVIYDQTDYNWSSEYAVTFERSNNVTFTFVSSTTNTFGVGVSWEIVQLKAETGNTISLSMAAQWGSKATATIGPLHSVRFRYGVWRHVYQGHLYYLNTSCQMTKSTIDKVYAPEYWGWVVTTAKLTAS